MIFLTVLMIFLILSLMIFLILSLMIFLILSLSKDAVNHPAPTFAEVSLTGDGWEV